MNEKELLEVKNLVAEAQKLLSTNNISGANAKLQLAYDKIKLPIGGGDNGPINK